MKRWRRRLALMLSSMAAALLLVEGGFRLLGLGAWENTLLSSIPGDVFAGPRVPGVLANLPTPGAEFILLGQRVRINPQGFRGEAPSPEDRRKLRVVALGDSCTFGWGVGEEETWPARLEARLNRSGPARVYNLGVLGMDTVEEAAWASRMAPPLEPQAVVLGLNLDDVVPHLEAGGARPVGRHVTQPASSGGLEWLRLHSNLYRYASFSWWKIRQARLHRQASGTDWAQHVRDCYVAGTPARTRWEGALLELAAACREWKCPFVVLVFPPQAPDATQDAYADLYRPVHEVLDGKPGVRIVELRDLLAGRECSPEAYGIPYDGHPRAWVYEVPAGALSDAILRPGK